MNSYKMLVIGLKLSTQRRAHQIQLKNITQLQKNIPHTPLRNIPHTHLKNILHMISFEWLNIMLVI